MMHSHVVLSATKLRATHLTEYFEFPVNPLCTTGLLLQGYK